MNKNYEKLFEPCKIAGVKMKNRMFMAPMGLVGFANPQGGFNKECQDYYIERARGGIGLIISGTVNVDYNEFIPFGLPCVTHNPVLFINSTRDMLSTIHSFDAKMFIQLTGGLGRSAIPGATTQQIAPSEVNPQCAFEREKAVEMAKEKKKVLIVGGGVGGMEAAMVLKQRGHEVVLAEQASQLGGLVNIADIPSFKKDERELIQWFIRQMEKLQVDVRLDTCVDEDYIQELNPDAVITATGGRPICLKLEGEKQAISAEDALMGREPLGEKVTVIGGGLVGCEVALWAAKQGKQVFVAEMLPAILGGMHSEIPFMNKSMLEDLLRFYHTEILVNTTVKEVNQQTVVLECAGERIEKETDTVIMAVGYTPNDDVYQMAKNCGKPVYNIGDSRKFHNIMQSIWDGFEIGRSL